MTKPAVLETRLLRNENAFITPCAKNSRSAVNAFTHALANIYLFKCKQ